jgi:cell division protein FtsL
MKKIILFISIFFLIVTTSLVKNSTKKTEDEIYSTSENIRSLKNELGDVLLEYNYLSSPEKLLDYQANYFENDLIRLDIIKIKKITKKNNRLIVSDFNQAIKKND